MPLQVVCIEYIPVSIEYMPVCTQFIQPIQYRGNVWAGIGTYWNFNTCQSANNNFTDAEKHPEQ